MKHEMIRGNELSPFNMFGDMEREMNRMMDNFWRNSMNQNENDFLPSCEVEEKDGLYMINFDLPGIPKDEIKVDVAEGRLHIHGERKSNHKVGNYNERVYGKFERTMTLPKYVSINDVTATFDNGVLTVALKKIAEPKMQRINISTKQPTMESKTRKAV